MIANSFAAAANIRIAVKVAPTQVVETIILRHIDPESGRLSGESIAVDLTQEVS